MLGEIPLAGTKQITDEAGSKLLKVASKERAERAIMVVLSFEVCSRVCIISG